MPEGNQIIKMNEENLEEASYADFTPDTSTDTSVDASANENI